MTARCTPRYNGWPRRMAVKATLAAYIWLIALFSLTPSAVAVNVVVPNFKWRWIVVVAKSLAFRDMAEPKDSLCYGLPKAFATRTTLRVLYSMDGKKIGDNQTIVARSNVNGFLGGGWQAPLTLGPIISPGTIAVLYLGVRKDPKGRTLYSLDNGDAILPCGLPLPSRVRAKDVAAVEGGLEALSKMEKMGYNGHPLWGLPLPPKIVAYARKMRRSKNFYKWALGITVYCAAANQHRVKSLIMHTLFLSKPLMLKLPSGRIYADAKSDVPRISLRRAIWEVHVLTTVTTPPDCRLSGFFATYLLTKAYYRSSGMVGKGFYFTDCDAFDYDAGYGENAIYRWIFQRPAARCGFFPGAYPREQNEPPASAFMPKSSDVGITVKVRGK
ncbi:MAG: hypothetical protein HKL96_05765 [Phycisphaerales bacterium]|nr:hypothetical protein [Phycisphaerales bacterium]